ncbi:MAG: hypothetical protein P8Z40_01390 [Chloroflexota bacterium]
MFEDPNGLPPSFPPPDPPGGLPDWRTALSWLRARRFPFGLAWWHVGLALLGLVVLAVGLLIALRAGSTRLTAANPTLTVDEFLTVEATGEGAARVRVRVGAWEDEEWEAARAALPPSLKPLSPLYQAHVRGAARLAFQGAENADLYRWDAEAGRWIFVPLYSEAGSEARWAEPVEGAVALFEVAGYAPLVSSTREAGQRLDAPSAAALNMLFLSGVEGKPDGTLDVEGLAEAGPVPDTVAALPVIRFSDPVALSRLLEDQAAQDTHQGAILALLATGNYRGVVLDYGAIDAEDADGYYRLVDDLAAALGEENALLALRLPAPEQTDSGWDTGPLDWERLGEAADLLIAPVPVPPAEWYPGGEADSFLAWADGQVSRLKLHVATSTMSVDEWAGQLNPITYQYALAPLGAIRVLDEAGQPALSPSPGDPLTFSLTGQALDLEQDERSGAYHYRVFAGDGEHHIWLTTGASLRQRLDLIAAHRVGGVVIDDLLSGGSSSGVLPAINEFRVSLPSSLPETLDLHWSVREASGTPVAQATGALGEPLLWTPEQEGEYIVSADLAGINLAGQEAAVIVGGENVGGVPEQEAVVGGPAAIPSDQPTALAAPYVEGMPPVYPAGARGNFELGGQVNHVITHLDYMNQAGMTWVKFQLAWAPDQDPDVAWDLIQRGRDAGFKVLLSIPGQVKYPTDIDVPDYLDFLRGVAYYGPDAIEVWNEANIDYEWPRGEIDGGAYVREMLAPAYNAIKEVNPNIMVISGALAPTGAFFAEGGCSAGGFGCDDWLYLQQMAQAGAVHYMDCVGAHFNSGATSPTVDTGHPADPGYGHYSWYFSGMLNLYGGTFGRPVCFTELGYLSGEGYGQVPDRFSWASGTTVAQQARWLAETAQLSAESGQVRLMIVWNVDFVYWGDDPMAGYAIVRPDGSCPACGTLGNVMP